MTTRVLSWWMPALCIAAAPIAGHGSTLYTFSFTQTGYVLQGTPFTGTLNGTFSGIAEPSGIIQLLDGNQDALVLSSTFEYTLGGELIRKTNTSLPNFFSFDINGGSSTLDFAQFSNTMLCVGAVAVFGGFGCQGGVFPGSYANQFLTPNFPVVSLVSAVPVLPPTPVTPASPVPETGALLMTGTGLTLMGLWLRRSRTFSRPPRVWFLRQAAIQGR